MKIKEVENLLSVSRSNIRFYEKEGLLSPNRENNNYRDYSEQDIIELKKILALRKLGFTVEEILQMQSGELSFDDAAKDNISRLEKEVKILQGALETTKSLTDKSTTFNNLDYENLWNTVTLLEHNGKKFNDVCKDYIKFEQDVFDNMWKFVFFHNSKKSRKKFGIVPACIILLLICTARGISRTAFFHESFWSGFLYPFFIFVVGSIIILPIYILSKKKPKIASVISTILLAICIGFLGICAIAVLCGIIMLIF